MSLGNFLFKLKINLIKWNFSPHASSMSLGNFLFKLKINLIKWNFSPHASSMFID